MRIKVTKILYVLLILSLIKFPFIPSFILRFFKVSIAGLSLLYLIQSKRVHIRRQFPILLFSGTVLLSGIMVYHLEIRFMYSLIYAAMIYEFVVLTDIWINHHGAGNYFLVMFYFLFFLCLFNDVCMIFNINFTTDAMMNSYILGNKFNVSYYHLLLLTFLAAMFVERYRDTGRVMLSNIVFLIFAAVAVVVSVSVDTRTGLIGIIVFVILYFLSGVMKNILANPIVTCIALYALSGTIFVWDYILSFDIVQNFIVRILHRSLSLTGRLGIYRILFQIFQQRPLFGWGYETSIVSESLYGNAQNGMVHLAIQYGVIGVVCFTVFVFLTMKRSGNLHDSKMVIVSAVYSFFVMGTVEIVFSNLFFVLMAILFAFSDKDEKAHRVKVEIKV